jgi:hypothetical protein
VGCEIVGVFFFLFLAFVLLFPSLSFTIFDCRYKSCWQ